MPRTPRFDYLTFAEMYELVFYAPEIPPNTGNAMRLSAVTGCRLHLIEPLGFEMDEARLRRAGLDYRDKATVAVHDSLESWREAISPGPVYAFTVDGETLYTDVDYQPGDSLLFGPESQGLPEGVQRLPWISARVRLPMVPNVRSINLSNAASIALYEAWRQQGFIGSS